MEDEQELEEYATRHMSPGRIVVRRILRYVLIALVIAVNALILWRVLFSDRIPSDLSALTVNDAVHEAYEEARSSGKELVVFSQEQETLTWNDRAYGYFWAAQTMIIPGADEIQLLVRYNDSTLGHIATDYELPVTPKREDTVLDVSLVVTRKTGETDEFGDPITESVRITTDGVVASGSKNMYNYRRYVFDGVHIDSSVTDVSVHFYYSNDVDYDAEPYGTLCLYSDFIERTPVKLTSADRRALEEYRK